MAFSSFESRFFHIFKKFSTGCGLLFFFLLLRYNEEGIRDSKFIDTHFESAIVNRIKKYTFSFQGENKNN